MQRKFKPFTVTAETLRGCRFFDEQSDAACDDIAKRCEGRVYRAGGEIISDRDDHRNVFFIVSGKVEARVITFHGKSVSFQTLNNGEMFGELSALDGRPRTTAVTAVTESTIVTMDGLSFRETVFGDTELTERTLRRLCDLARHLFEKAYSTRAYSVPDQIRLEIYHEVRAQQPHTSDNGELLIKPAPTHKEIAERVGTTREQVTRVIKDLSDRSLLHQEKRMWLARNVDALIAYLEDLLRPLEC